MLSAMLRQPLRPAAAAAAIEKRNKKYGIKFLYCGFFSIAALLRPLLRRRSKNDYCGGAAIEDEGAPQ